MSAGDVMRCAVCVRCECAGLDKRGRVRCIYGGPFVFRRITADDIIRNNVKPPPITWPTEAES